MKADAVRELLSAALKDVQALALLGCGSPLRGDDAAGSLVAERLAGLGEGSGSWRVGAFMGDVAPENLTGELKAFGPDLLLAVDAVDLGLAPGEMSLVPLEAIGGVSFSSHILPLSIVLDYLRREIGCEVMLLGIQAATTEFMAPMTPAVEAAVDELCAELEGLLGWGAG